MFSYFKWENLHESEGFEPSTTDAAFRRIKNSSATINFKKGDFYANYLLSRRLNSENGRAREKREKERERGRERK